MAQNKPIVALGSAEFTHSMEFPLNKDTALELVKIIRDNGATPAIIAIIKGVIRVGLTDKEIWYLCSNEVRKSVRKCSRRDLAFCLSKGMDGSTTVAGCMYIANLVGIKIFAAGGLGGVHRGVEETFDISADLGELARTPVYLVSAGVKGILDIPKTLEYLETVGVPVCAIG